MLADSHCHLNYKGLVEEQSAILTRARDRGVTAMLNISTRESEWDAVIATAEREPDVWATVGIHPHEADAHPHIDTAKLIERARHPRVVGGHDASDQFAGIRIAGNNRALPGIERGKSRSGIIQPQPRFGGSRSMTAETTSDENRPDVAVEVHRLRISSRDSTMEQAKQQQRWKNRSDRHDCRLPTL